MLCWLRMMWWYCPRTLQNPSRPPKTPFLRLSKKGQKRGQNDGFQPKILRRGGSKTDPLALYQAKKKSSKIEKIDVFRKFFVNTKFFFNIYKNFFLRLCFFPVTPLLRSMERRFRIEISLFSDPSFLGPFLKKEVLPTSVSLTTKVLRSDASTSLRCSIGMDRSHASSVLGSVRHVLGL